MQTTELEDGTVVVLESEADREAREIEAILRGEQPSGITRVIDVRPSVADDERRRQQHAGAADAALVVSAGGDGGDGDGAGAQGQSDKQEDNDATTIRKNQKKDQGPSAANQRKISRAERRRLIKEEIQRLAQDETKAYYQPRLW